MLDRIGGWKRHRLAEDRALIDEVVRAGEHVYRTHSKSFLPVRHGHAWEADDARFLAQAKVEEAGFRPDLAGIVEAPPPP